MHQSSEPDHQRTIALFPSAGADETTLYRPATLLWMAGVALVCVPMVTLVDVPIARWFAGDPLPRELGKALDLTEVFSHGSGVFLILVGVVLMAPRRRWQVPRLAALALGGGAAAIITKMFVLRPKPSGLNFDIATFDSAWLWAFDWSLAQVAMFDASTRAFPSANMATAVALTVGLWVVLPRGRWLFAVVCLGTMLQRLYCGAHFLSDLFGGAALGLLWAYTCFEPRLLGSLFDKMAAESRPPRRTGLSARETTGAVRRDKAA